MTRLARGALVLVVTVFLGAPASAATTLTAADGAAAAGEVVSITITMDTDEDILGFSLGMAHDGDALTLDDIAEGTAVSERNGGSGPDYFLVEIDPTGGPGGYVACVVDFELGDSIPIGDGQELVIFEYTVSESAAGGVTDLLFSDDLGDPPVDTLVVLDGAESVDPSTLNGTVDIDLGAPVFRRGDCDGNGIYFPLLDALYILTDQFQSGPPPPCLDAADTDGNNIYFPLLDALYILNDQFQNGPPPPDPGPTTCGPDPDVDALDCLTPPSNC